MEKKIKPTPVNRKNMYRWIYNILKGDEMTAKEIAVVLYYKGLIPYPVRQATAPRLTEMEHTGKVKVVGTKVDFETKKSVSIYACV